ncbi:tRNA (adenosine(37)-N6)-threonylcarbamoyltransferase complex dimerization subunit type 1 TsaB [Spirulina sp. CCNP1310]|uniref:tRNA (adenosine(37)-N6)-threonylcarbamoyltransferase complex dimerization subunit type 1 TsaB n=1 Tax=Spirulina sp. CCNP1310 TaxID=3110249 RepID=UPI002B1F16F2|nr:tRNA (adenosine(37)-N6)-threonylcarbamoyltransferase complex dimerization subunit type 1 TsaB [Spirulina sp. CCNP1310]
MGLAGLGNEIMIAYGLALQTTTTELGLAKGTGLEPEQVQVWDLGRSLSTDLHDYLQNFLPPQTWRDLAFITIAQGPGGFTGTRIGMVTARTLAQQLQIPLFPFSTLATVAWQTAQHEEFSTPWIAVDYPARRGELFGGIYRVTSEGVETAQGDERYTPEQWEQTLAAFPHFCQRVTASEQLGHTVGALFTLGAMGYGGGDRPHWARAKPFYGQHPV